MAFISFFLAALLSSRISQGRDSEIVDIKQVHFTGSCLAPPRKGILSGSCHAMDFKENPRDKVKKKRCLKEMALSIASTMKTLYPTHPTTTITLEQMCPVLRKYFSTNLKLLDADDFMNLLHQHLMDQQGSGIYRDIVRISPYGPYKVDNLKHIIRIGIFFYMNCYIK